MAERKSHRDIDGVNFLRHGIEKRRHEIFIRKHYRSLFESRVLSLGTGRICGVRKPLRIKAAQNRHDCLCLTECRRNGYHRYIRIILHLVEPHAVARREHLDVAAYEPRRTVPLDIHCRGSIVPVEIGYAHALHRPEYRLLRLRQYAETGEHIAVAVEIVGIHLLQQFGHLAVNHAAVAVACCAKPFPESVIYFLHHLPQLYESCHILIARFPFAG